MSKSKVKVFYKTLPDNFTGVLNVENRASS